MAAQAQAALYNELSVGLGTIQYDPEVVLPENPLDGLMGPGFFATPILIVLPNRPIDDRLVDEINKQSSADVISNRSANGLHLTDSQLELYGRLRNLKELNLPSCPAITDAGMRHLRGLDKLERLYIEDSRITDEGLQNLGGLSKLNSIALVHTAVTGTGFKYLCGRVNPQVLTLASMPLTSPGLAEVGRLTTIGSLNLAGSPVDDAGLAQLKNMKQLIFLCLRGTNITAESLPTLQALPHLRFLELDPIKGISWKAMGRIKNALPNCNFE